MVEVASPDNMLVELVKMIIVSGDIATATLIHDTQFGQAAHSYYHVPSSDSSVFVDLSSARFTALSHLVVKLDMHLGEIRSQLSRLAELDMKNYFILGRYTN